jgi:hypothetical protein
VSEGALLTSVGQISFEANEFKMTECIAVVGGGQHEVNVALGNLY